MNRLTHRILGALTAVLLPIAGACDVGGFLDVESPGVIVDDDLNNLDAVSSLVTGMSFELADALAGGDFAAQGFTGIASGELFHGGSYDWADIPRGVINPEDANGTYGDFHEARYTAESGIQRMRDNIFVGEDAAAFDSNQFVARAYLIAGFANRMTGEAVCRTTIDNSEAMPNTVHFERAEGHFTEAIRIGEAAGADDVVTAAYGGRASVRAWLGDWAGAVSDAQQVPDDFVHYALFDALGPENAIVYETTSRYEYTVFQTEFADHPNDPRVPWDTVFNADGSIAVGANGATPMYQQLKYDSDGSDVPLMKGAEMLLLRAENALRQGLAGIASAYSFMNQARALYGMDPLVPTATLDEAWEDLHYERGATLWLEGRRLWDLRRWFNEGAGTPAYHPFLEGRDTCIPISETELQTNPNVG